MVVEDNRDPSTSCFHLQLPSIFPFTFWGHIFSGSPNHAIREHIACYLRCHHCFGRWHLISRLWPGGARNCLLCPSTGHDLLRTSTGHHLLRTSTGHHLLRTSTGASNRRLRASTDHHRPRSCTGTRDRVLRPSTGASDRVLRPSILLLSSRSVGTHFRFLESVARLHKLVVA